MKDKYSNDSFSIEFLYGDHTGDAVSIRERALRLMRECRVRLFDLTRVSHNVVFELGWAVGAELPNRYSLRKAEFGGPQLPSMLKELDCHEYRKPADLERVICRFLSDHFWPSDRAYLPETSEHKSWLARQIAYLTRPGCETDKYELAEAIGISHAAMTGVINEHFVQRGNAVALSSGPAPRYRFDYTSLRPIPPVSPELRAPSRGAGSD